MAPISNTAPFALTLGATVGMGADAGHATVTAKVQNINGDMLSGVTVRFTTDVGTLSALSVATGVDGMAMTTITATNTATLTASAGTLTAKMLVASQPVAVVPTVPAPSVPGPDTPSAGPLSVTLSSADVTLGTQTIVSAQVKNGSPQNVVWSFGDGATFTGTSPTTAHTYGAVGHYVVSASVTDTAGRTASGSTNATVNVVPPPPAAAPPPAPAFSVMLVATPATVIAGSNATLSATVAPLNGATAVPTTYVWNCNNDTSAGVTTTTNSYGLCSYPNAGTSTAKVTVSGGGLTGTGTTSIVVTAAPPPSYTVTLTATPTSVVQGSATSLVASVATAGGAPAPANYMWDCGNGTITTTTSNTQNCTYNMLGSITPKVTVTGGTVIASATTPVTVTASGPPVVTVACNTVALPTATACAASATLNGAQMPSTAIAAVTWDFGDGTATATTTTNTASHTYPASLTYHVVAIATIAGAPITGTGTATVQPSSGTPAVTVACNTVPLMTPTSCIVSATLNGSPVPPTAITNVTWDFGDGSSPTMTPSNSTTHLYAAALTAYPVVVTATISYTPTPGMGSGTAVVQ